MLDCEALDVTSLYLNLQPEISDSYLAAKPNAFTSFCFSWRLLLFRKNEYVLLLFIYKFVSLLKQSVSDKE